jgi:ring-1,2-phenylacetyl-CoA epoxidase subunit PaaE
MSGLHFHTLHVSQAQADGDDACLISLAVPEALQEVFQFEPGQYLTLRAQVGGQELRRSYSICAAPGEPLRVGVRRVAGGQFSPWAHQSLKPGVAVQVLPPQGRFGAALLRPDQKSGLRRHLLGVAGGSGITPILSLLKAALARDATTRFTLFYGNRQAASTMFKDELEDLKNRYLTRLAIHTVFSREQVDSPIASGRLDRAKIAQLLRLAGPVHEAFVCGPHALNDEAEAALLAAGLAPECIHIERFGLPPAEAARVDHSPQLGDAAVATLTVVRDGVTREVPYASEDGNVLAAAARAGLDVPYSCKSGVCATCRAKLLHGQVRMERNFALDAQELAAGFVLTCQAHPTTERVVVSFDER